MLKNVGGKNGNNKIWKKLILLFIKDALNWFKVTVKFYVATKKLFKINAILYLKNNPKTPIVIWSSTPVFSIDNKRCFLSTKSAYFKSFLKDHVTLKTGAMTVETSALLSQE